MSESNSLDFDTRNGDLGIVDLFKALAPRVNESKFYKEGKEQEKNSLEINVRFRNNDRLLKTSDLENLFINRGLDKFISRQLLDQTRELSENVIEEGGETDVHIFYSRFGLHANAIGQTLLQNYSVGGKSFEPGTEVTTIDFIPGRRGVFDPSKITDSLTYGIEGIVEMLAAIDAGTFKPDPMFVGVTNINMALMAQRLGFIIVDQCRTPDGKINKSLTQFTVVGHIDEIRKRVEELKKSGVDKRVIKRSEKTLKARTSTA